MEREVGGKRHLGKRMTDAFRWVSVAVAATVAWPALAFAAPLVFEAAGTTPADIQAAVDDFRDFLGDNNGAGGTFPGGRREINWDGVPDRFAAPNDLPANFFNANSPRGVVFFTPGSGFQISGNAGVAPIEFDISVGTPHAGSPPSAPSGCSRLSTARSRRSCSSSPERPRQRRPEDSAPSSPMWIAPTVRRSNASTSTARSCSAASRRAPRATRPSHSWGSPSTRAKESSS
jgi:hypothetical protein